MRRGLSWPREQALEVLPPKRSAFHMLASSRMINTDVDVRLTPGTSPAAVTLPSSDTLKVVLTVVEGKTAKKPHQAFLTLQEPTSGLEESFPFSLKDNGKGKVEVVR